jgi:hypothetical protein
MNLIVGDSHSDIIFDNSKHLLCSAGSAKGLNNPNSVSQYNKTIIDHIKNNNYKNIFFLFGGVDVDFSYIHNYLDNPEINYVDFNFKIIKNYLEFITINFSDKSIILLSIGLPVLDDDNLKRGLLNAHINYLESKDLTELQNKLSKVDLPNIFDRTKITLNFNEQLKNEIYNLNMENIKFLDITTFTYDENLKRINNMLFTRADHHSFKRNNLYTQIINDFLKNNNM